MLSATTDRALRAEVLDAGAADFVGKPFVNCDLLARIRARLRRREIPRPGQVPAPRAPSDVALDADSRGLVLHGRRTPLSPREFKLLAHLLMPS